VEFGHQYGDFAIYAVGDATHDNGFRQTSTSDLYRLYTDLGWRSGGEELHLGMTAAHDELGNPGATPVQALNANLSNIFTAPNVVDNTYLGFNLTAAPSSARAPRCRPSRTINSSIRSSPTAPPSRSWRAATHEPLVQ